MKITNYVLMTTMVLTLSSCATTSTNQPLTPEVKSSVKSTHVILNTTQREIVLKHNNPIFERGFDPYNPMDSGAIVQHNEGVRPASANPAATLIASAIVTGVKYSQAKSTADIMTDVHNAVSPYNYAADFNHQLQNKLTTVPWLHIQKQELRYNIKERAQQITAKNKENATLFIGTTYALNSTFKQLEVVAYVKLMKKGPGKSNSDVVYENNFYFMDRLENPSRDKMVNRNIWIADNGKMLKNKLSVASGVLSSMIASDLSKGTTNPNYDANKIVKFYHIDGPQARGYFVKNQNGYEIISVSNFAGANGNLYALKPNMTIQGS